MKIRSWEFSALGLLRVRKTVKTLAHTLQKPQKQVLKQPIRAKIQ